MVKMVDVTAVEMEEQMQILPQESGVEYGGASEGRSEETSGGASEEASEEAFPWACRGVFAEACQRAEEWDSGLAQVRMSPGPQLGVDG